MPQISLTDKQQNWLAHINNASDQKISLVHYAKENNLHIKNLYAARTVLVKKGVLERPETTHFSKIIENQPPEPINACRVILQNGVRIEFEHVDMVALLKTVSQL